MKLISHRGNLDGKNLEKENSPDYISEAIKLDYDVEIDLWVINDELFLGHDEPTYKINFRWIRDRISKLWIHCKNIDTMNYLCECGYVVNYFWHQNDDVTITSRGFFWTYPDKQLTENSIALFPEIYNYDNLKECYGICSDNIKLFDEIMLK